MSDESEEKPQEINEVVKAMGDQVKPDVPTGLATIPKGMSAQALARRTAGEIVQNELEFHCGSCGWNKSLHFDNDELEAMKAAGDTIRDYTGPCPKCGNMTLTPKDAYWGRDFPSMSELAQKNKRQEARVQAEEFVEVVAEKVGDMMGGSIPKPKVDESPKTAEAEVVDEIDVTKLTPR